MNKYLLAIIVFAIFQFNAFSQKGINNYKYIIIPSQFDYQSSEDQYQLNSLTKFLFNKYGYEAYLSTDEFPADLASDNCLGLKANVKEVKGGFLWTKIEIDLVDCQNQVIATSQTGKSKLKDRSKAYNESIREAFTTYQFFDYTYTEKTAKVAQQPKEEVSKPKAIEKTNVASMPISEEKLDDKVTNTVAETTKTVQKTHEEEAMLYAQPIDNGFQVVDTEPKKVMILLNSGVPDTFIVEGKDAIVYKKDTVWIYAENTGKRLISNTINLKF